MRHSSGLPSTCITASKACLHGRGGASEIILHKAVFFFSPQLQQVLQAWLLQEREDFGCTITVLCSTSLTSHTEVQLQPQ